MRTFVALAVLLLAAGCAGTGSPADLPAPGGRSSAAEASTGSAPSPKGTPAGPSPKGSPAGPSPKSSPAAPTPRNKSAGPSPKSGGSPTASPSATASSRAAAAWQLRYLLLGHYPDFAFCDPDLYPVARGDQQSAADDWWTGTDHGSPEAQVILTHLGYHPPLTPSQRLSAYGDHKKLTVIAMTPASGGYQFHLSTGGPGGEPDQTVTGLITFAGGVAETSRRARPGGCPICLEAATRIATPAGDLPVEQLRPGDPVWTLDTAGRRTAATIERGTRRATPGPHLMLRLALADGRVLVAAGAHPAPDGSYLRQVRPGQDYDGAVVVSVDWMTSTAPATFDLLPTGPTAAYWANGILVGSTLQQQQPGTLARVWRDG